MGSSSWSKLSSRLPASDKKAAESSKGAAVPTQVTGTVRGSVADSGPCPCKPFPPSLTYSVSTVVRALGLRPGSVKEMGLLAR